MRQPLSVLSLLLPVMVLAACSSEPTSTATPSPTLASAPSATPTLAATPTPTLDIEPTPTPSPVPGAMSIVIEPDADATLYDRGTLLAANGAGQSLFFGATNGNEPRRALLHFNLASELPAGAEVGSVRLVLTVTRARGDANEALLHRVTAAWGEGTADSETAGEGSGTEPDDGSATWVHREFPEVMWGTPGGDYDAAGALATTVVLPPPRPQTIEVSWGSTDAMVADVQRWLDDPTSNFGWLIIGDEAGRQSTKRVASRENADEAMRPQLLIEYFPSAG